jgi:hypothetical protein
MAFELPPLPYSHSALAERGMRRWSCTTTSTIKPMSPP